MATNAGITFSGGIQFSGGYSITGDSIAANDPYWQYVSYLSQSTAVNAQQNNTFLDASTNNFTITRNGSTTQGSAAPFGNNWSNYFNGSTDYLTLPSSSTAYNFGVGVDFTVEAWVYPLTNAALDWGIIDARVSGATAAAWLVTLVPNGAGCKVNFYNAGANSGTTVVPLNTWSHIAVVRQGTALRTYVNGVVDLNNTSYGSGSISPGTTAPRVGTTKDASGTAYATIGYISNLRIVNGTALYTATFTPPTAALTPVTGTSLLTCQSPAFQDNSPNAFALTAAGTSSVQRFSPFSNYLQTPQSYSTKFNGSTDSLSVASNSAFGFGTGDFTIEGWVYPTVNARQDWVDITNGTQRILLYYSGSAITFYSVPPNAAAITGPAMVLNTWQHIAVSKQSGSTKLFVNGVQVGSTYATNQDYGTASTLTIGKDSAGSTYVTGYMSNVRVVKGTAVYTANFTPPTSPLTAISGTSLLTCQNATIVDNSTNAFTLTTTGAPTPYQYNPFGYTTSAAQSYSPTVFGGSMYFDGTGDYLTVPANAALTLGTSDYTVECWVNLQGTQTTTYGWGVIGTYPGSGTGWSISINRSSGGYGIFWILGGAIIATYTTAYIPVGAWTHLAVTRSGSGTNNTKLFLNGVPVTQVTDNTNDTFSGVTYIGGQGTGQLFTGYISNARVVKGTALYTAPFLPSLTPLTSVTNTQLLMLGTNAGIFDNAMTTTFETVGNAQISTTQKKYGTGSMYFDGTGDYLSSPINVPSQFGSSDFTIECWIYFSDVATDHSLMYWNANASGYAAVHVKQTTGKWALWMSTSGSAWAVQQSALGSTITANTWYYVTVVRSGTNVKMYVNGVDVTSGGYTVTGSLMTTYTLNQIGVYNTSSYYMNGYVDDFRMTIGYARYTANFTPPTQALPTS
jgi:hypothetical protein